ncbi:hypothetical protein EDD15DRAFT_2250757 [Pisolithus albus]|nr:hypothetical protein EDD15DRAFT_2250757 [Pisolithus albus]
MSATTTMLTSSDAAKQLQDKLENTKLHILDARADLKSYHFESLDDSTSGEGALSDPAIVASDVAAQILFLRKLKFQYLEQNAKDKYVKTIVSDDAPLITAASNEQIRLRNEEKKRNLKEEKLKLLEKQQDVRTLAPLVEEDYQKARSLTSLGTSLSAKILDAKLALTRLRQAHPQPRLTIATATATLDEQAEMREVERLRAVEKEGIAELEHVGKEGGDEDPRLSKLYDWLQAALTAQRSLLSLGSSRTESENELRLTYNILSPFSKMPKELVLTLLFVPNTRQLASASARLDGEELDLGDMIYAPVQANDIPTLVWSVYACVKEREARLVVS